MVVSATIGAGLILLVVLSEALNGFLWRDDGMPLFYCPTCDLRFARSELARGVSRRCPHGHALDRSHGFSWTVALSTACLTVVAVGLFRMATGLGM
jgi:hypothetical protein